MIKHNLFGQNLISCHQNEFQGVFYAKNTKNDKNVSTLWRHYDVKTTADKILNTIFGILVQLAFRMVIMFFFHWVGDRAKISRDKKK